MSRTGKILRRSERASERASPVRASERDVYRQSMVHLYAASGRGRVRSPKRLVHHRQALERLLPAKAPVGLQCSRAQNIHTTNSQALRPM